MGQWLKGVSRAWDTRLRWMRVGGKVPDKLTEVADEA